MLSKEINLNKKFILGLILVNVIVLALYYSYALFQINVIQDNIIVINTGIINLTVTTGIENNVITIPAGETKTINVSLSSTNTNEIGYKLYYTGSGNLTFQSPKDFNDNIVQGTMTSSDSFVLVIKNNGSSSTSITLNGKGGIASYNIPLETGQNELTLSPMVGSDKVKTIANSVPNCTRTITDTDGTIYISGKSDNPSIYSNAETDSCVIDFNYVWWSGKMWRITAIYPDGSMKLITEDALTAIYWGSNAEAYYDTTNNVGSWVYQWLNEDFYDTLVKADDYLIKNAEWNFSTDGNSTPVKPSTIETQKTTNAPVGLLNAYEYSKGYANAATGTNYLNIGYYWWLITPYSSSNVRRVNNNGHLDYGSPTSGSFGVRPSIYLKSGINLTGTGTKTNPFEINDNELVSAKTGELLNSRMSGEYVNFDNDLYRIVSTENDVTKLTRVDYLRDETSSETIKPVLNKNFASSAYFGKTGNTESDDYWDYYLNNTWYDSISSDYQNMMVDGIFYLGLYAGSGKHYKITICSDTASTLDGKITKLGVEGKSCTRYTSSNANKTFTGKVGLQRVGEMFSAQLGSGYSSSSNIWLITPYNSSNVRYVGSNGYLDYSSPTSYSRGVRPSINLTSNVTIKGGTGLYESPYEIEYTPPSP